MLIYIRFFLLSLCISAPLHAMMESIDPDDKRGTMAIPPDKFLESTLTHAKVRYWLRASSILSEQERQGTLEIERAERDASSYAEDIFFIKTSAQQLVLKVWGKRRMSDEDCERRCRNTYAVSKAGFVKKFKEPDYPQLMIDLWAGFYTNADGQRHYLNLMPRASGQSLERYLTEHRERAEDVVIQLAKVFGNAHRETLEKNEDDPEGFFASFCGHDVREPNIFIDVSQGCEKAKISLIDLEDIGKSLKEHRSRRSVWHDIKALLHLLDVYRNVYLHKKEIGLDQRGKVTNEQLSMTTTFLKSYTDTFGEQAGPVRDRILALYQEETEKSAENLGKYNAANEADDDKPCKGRRLLIPRSAQGIEKIFQKLAEMLSVPSDLPSESASSSKGASAAAGAATN